MSLPHVVELIDLEALLAMHVLESDGERILHCAFKLAEREYAEVVSELKLPTFVGFHTFHVAPPVQSQPIEQLPEGQAFLVDSTLQTATPGEALPEATGTVIDVPLNEQVVDAPASKNGKKNGGSETGTGEQVAE
ncbi:MAG TPA: hypothetical protein VFA10_17875 [Ktedonobacteraceae bacterium]|nr:hypothetical protein [Ktedonobacteraceae bacterium]